MENNNKNKRSPAFDLEALSKAYEDSLNNVTMGDKDIPTPPVRKKTPVPDRELKSFVPRDYRPAAESSPEHDKIVDKIRADRRKRSHSVWTDQPVLKPKKSVWIDDSADDVPGSTVGVQRQYTAPKYTAPAAPKYTAPKYTAPAAPKPAPKQLPPDFIAPLPIMTEPEPLPDLGALVDDAVRDKKKDQVVPLLNEKPRKQELVMNVGAHGDTRVREIPQRVNKQKIMVDMSGYDPAEDTSTKRTVSLKMPLRKMKLDDIQPQKTEVKVAVPLKKETPAADKTVQESAEETVKPAEKVSLAKPRTETEEELEKTAVYVPVKPEEAAAPVSEKAEDTVAVPAEETAQTDETIAEETPAEGTPAAPEFPASDDPDGGRPENGYNFSAMFKKVQAEKKGRVREEYENSDANTHTLITEKAQRHGVEPQYIMPKKNLAKRKKPLTHELEFQFINCIMCICVIFVIFFSLLFMERESGFINSENRELAKFPEFSISEYFKGNYTKDITEYFTDTIPGREELKKFGAAYDRMKGVDLGGAKVSGKHKTAKKETLDEDKLAAVTEVTANTDPAAVTTAEAAESKAETTTTSAEKEEVVKLPDILDDGVVEGDVIVFGKGEEVRAVSGYYGTFDTGRLYAQTINKYKEALPDVNVYNMSIPTSSAYYLPKNFRDTVADQKDNIDNIASELKGIINVDVYNAVGAHTDEYIYSRTDHHWQPLGAYYAGKVFADKAGVKYPDISTYEKCQIDDFLGTMYAYSNYDSELSANPDTFIYYKPDNEYTTYYYDTDFTNGEESSLFFDFAEGVNCYSAILGKDEEITEIDTDADSGRTLVIFKDSFGNALVPFFTHSFDKIYVCDFRYFDVNAIEFCRAVGCTDLLFSISLTSCSTEMHITAINNDRIQESAAPIQVRSDEAVSSEAETQAETSESEAENAETQPVEETQVPEETEADSSIPENNDELGG